ncbi:hypothetical protein M9H77_08494 [Catharanthus roseus]|uniref:Uncharacterized protein n=1 Tax=Catharanthus roseus TaxID=4058 RepID=A0ACC0BY43_CATRO|nr:hypothetical protein M9H77_08494 [Catharanthus roseus]
MPFTATPTTTVTSNSYFSSLLLSLVSYSLSSLLSLVFSLLLSLSSVLPLLLLRCQNFDLFPQAAVGIVTRKVIKQERSWMYRKCVPSVRGLSSEFVNGVHRFVDWCLSWKYSSEIKPRHPSLTEGDIQQRISDEFAKWFRDKMYKPGNMFSSLQTLRNLIEVAFQEDVGIAETSLMDHKIEDIGPLAHESGLSDLVDLIGGHDDDVEEDNHFINDEVWHLGIGRLDNYIWPALTHLSIRSQRCPPWTGAVNRRISHDITIHADSGCRADISDHFCTVQCCDYVIQAYIPVTFRHTIRLLDHSTSDSSGMCFVEFSDVYDGLGVRRPQKTRLRDKAARVLASIRQVLTHSLSGKHQSVRLGADFSHEKLYKKLHVHREGHEEGQFVDEPPKEFWDKFYKLKE